MPFFRQVTILSYNAKELFDMVLDIESYSEFLPWCHTARIITQNEEYMIAELTVQLKGYLAQYQSKIISRILNKDTYLIEVVAISGPFKYLKNIWQFSAEDKSTKVEFLIDFKMKSIIFNNLINIFFANATEKMVSAFERRAKILLSSSISVPRINS